MNLLARCTRARDSTKQNIFRWALLQEPKHAGCASILQCRQTHGAELFRDSSERHDFSWATTDSERFAVLRSGQDFACANNAIVSAGAGTPGTGAPNHEDCCVCETGHLPFAQDDISRGCYLPRCTAAQFRVLGQSSTVCDDEQRRVYRLECASRFSRQARSGVVEGTHFRVE